jgi:DNA replication protein DnaC
LLMGEPSVGKTLAASYVVQDAARHHDWNGTATGGEVEPIQFVLAADLTRVDTYDRVDNARLDLLRRCQLLVVDDMGDESGAPGRSALATTILKRDAAGRPTVITTNLKAERFREMYGAPFVARIMARGIVPNLANEKPRRKRAA